MQLETVYSSMLKRASEYGMTKEAINKGKILDTVGDIARRAGDNISTGFRRLFPKRVPATNPDKLVTDAYNATKDVKRAPKANSVGVPTEMNIVGNYNTRMTPDIEAIAKKVGETPENIAEAQARLKQIQDVNGMEVVPGGLSNQVYYDTAPRFRKFMNTASNLTNNEAALAQALRNRNKPLAKNKIKLSPELVADAKDTHTGWLPKKTRDQIWEAQIRDNNRQLANIQRQQMEYLNRHPGKDLWDARMKNGVKPEDYILNPETKAEADFRRNLWGTHKLIDDMKWPNVHPNTLQMMLENGTLK